MESEHYASPGDVEIFKSTNYGIVTTPRREWDIAVKKEVCTVEDLQHERRIPDYKNLVEMELAVRARLIPEEVLAVVLYTGPMVIICYLICTACACM